MNAYDVFALKAQLDEQQARAEVAEARLRLIGAYAESLRESGQHTVAEHLSSYLP